MTDGAAPSQRPFIRRGRDGQPDLEPGRRLFIAVPVPDAISDLVAEIVGRIRSEQEASAGATSPGGRMPHQVRWVRLDDLHLTIRFLGPTLDERLDALREAVSAAGAEVTPFPLGITGAGAFPSLERPRALWLGVADPTGELARLAGAVAHRLTEAGWPVDDRPYTPHLTLARTDGVRSGPRVARRLVAETQGLERWFEVDRVVLFESHTGGGPARYVPLHVVHLGAVPEA